MRLLGGIMIIGGCLGLGLWYRNQFTDRIRALRSLSSILEMFMSEIRYGKATLSECCKHLAGRMDEPYGSCFLSIYREMSDKRGASFPEVFGKHMGKCLDGQAVKRQEKDIFLKIFMEQGFWDGEMQMKSMEQGRMQLRQILTLQEKEQREKSRVAVGLGAMSGLLLVVILM